MSPRKLAPLVLLVALTGCGSQQPSQRLKWSPDGARALLLPGDGLYLMDAAGTLSPRLVPDVYDAAWLDDSERLVVGRRRTVKTWSALADGLGADRARELADRAERLWSEGAFFRKPPPPDRDGDRQALLLYVKAHHADALRGRLGDGWTPPGGNGEPTVTLTSLALARAIVANIDVGPTLHEDTDWVAQILPAPGGRMLAFVTATDDSTSGELFVMPVDASAPPVEVDSNVARFPTWSPDGRSLAYVGSKDIPMVLVRDVVDVEGRIDPGEPDERAALMLFESSSGRVRFLPDGRVLFNSWDVRFPVTDQSDPIEQLFVLGHRGGTPVAPLTPLLPRSSRDELPESIHAFELSPDATQLLVTGGGGTFVVDMSTGGVQPVLDASGSGFVAWRAPGEFTYVKAIGERWGLFLRRGDDETELSCGWPEPVLEILAH